MTSRTRAAGVASEFVIEPGQGDSVALGRLGVVFKLDGHISGGAFAVVEHPMAPGALVPPHTHEHEDEYSYVLAGTIGARIGDQDCEIGAGSYLLKPRGISHAFWNAGPAPAHVLEIISPAGFEHYFREVAPLLAHAPDVDPSAIADVASRYGLTFQWEQMPELMEKYGVALA